MAERVSPTLPTAFSSINGVGAPVAYFQPSRPARIVPIVGAAICGLGAALALAYGLAVTGTAYSRYGWAVVDVLGRTPALLFWLFIVGGLVFLIYAVVAWRKAVAVYEEGIALRSLRALRAWSWADVTALYMAMTHEVGIFPRTSHRYTIEHISGERASFDDWLENVGQLGALVSRQLVERRYPPAAARFNAGEPVNFGHLSLDQNEIRLKGRSVAWDQVESVTVRRGYFEIQGKDGKRSGLDVAAIPNLDVLLLLLDHVTELQLEE